MIYKLKWKERHNFIRHAHICAHMLENFYLYLDVSCSKGMLTSVSCKPMATSFSISGKDCLSLLVRSCSASLAELICAPWCIIMWCAFCRVCSSSFLQLLRCSLKRQLKHYSKHTTHDWKKNVYFQNSQIFHYSSFFMHNESQFSLLCHLTFSRFTDGFPFFPGIHTKLKFLLSFSNYKVPHIYKLPDCMYLLKFAFFIKIRRYGITWAPPLSV